MADAERDDWFQLARWFRVRHWSLVKAVKARRGWDDGDILGTLLLAQVKAVRAWDRAKGAWLPFAALVMRQALLNALEGKRAVPTASGGSLANLADDRDAYRDVHAAWDREEVAGWWAWLKPRERLVIEGRFGFTGEPQTLAALGERLGATKQWAGQVEQAALARLRPPVLARLG